MSKPTPELHVEGADDKNVVSALLARHGIDTAKGKRFLLIKDWGNDEKLLDGMIDEVRASTEVPVGFMLDIDIAIEDRWAAVRAKFRTANISVPDACPPHGFIGQVSGYPVQFGVWLMPDCKTDSLKLEHLCKTLVPPGDPLWPHCELTVGQAATIVDAANKDIAEASERWTRYRDVDRIKSEVHTWLSWQVRPGAGLGAAINARVLSHNSPEALAFLRWVRDLYGFEALTPLGPRGI